VIGGPTSPGPLRSPTDISLAQLAHVPSQVDVGEGTSRSAAGSSQTQGLGFYDNDIPARNSSLQQEPQDMAAPPPDYESPQSSPRLSDSNNSEGLMLRPDSPRPPVPSYDFAVGQSPYPTTQELAGRADISDDASHSDVDQESQDENERHESDTQDEEEDSTSNNSR